MKGKNIEDFRETYANSDYTLRKISSLQQQQNTKM